MGEAKLKINVNMSPDEYMFKDSDGVQIRAATWRGVIRKVKDYRKRAGREVGDVEGEVMAQACQRNPHICIKSNEVPYPPQDRNPKSGIKVRVLQWLAAWKRQRESPDGIVYVTENAAKERASTCAKCQFNTLLPSGCSSCKAALRSLRESVVGPHRALDGRLGGCDVLGSDLPSSVHLDEIRVRKAELPDGCWRKAT